MMRQALNQTATWWSATSNGFGGYNFGLPIPIKCRWEESSELLPGTTKISKAVVYVDRDISVEDYLFLGTSSSSTPDAVGALRVQEFKKVPDLRSLEALRKAWL